MPDSKKHRVPVEKPAVRAPNPREVEAMAAARQYCRGRTAPLEYEVEEGAGEVMRVSIPHSDEGGFEAQRRKTFGTVSQAFASHSAGRVAAIMRQRGKSLPSEVEFNAGIAAVAGIEPTNEAEAMLAVQMVSTYEVAMESLSRAKMATDSVMMERHGTLATKLMRTYVAQMEALTRLRRGGEQKVRVEHVHVYQGGQAIVGNVSQQPAQTGGYRENGSQPHAPTDPRTLSLAPGGPLLREDAPRDRVPVTSGGREEAVPDARRRKRQRRA